MTLRLNGSTSGYTEIDAPAVAGSNTLVLPTSNGSDGNILGTDGAGNLSWVGGRMVLETAQASTSGTSIDFTGIPSWVKRVTVMFSDVSTNGTSIPLVQLGSGSVQTSGYLARTTPTAGGSGGNSTAGFTLQSTATAGDTLGGSYIFNTLGSNTWVGQGQFITTTSANFFGSGRVVLSGTLDRIRITTVNGTDTFDAGSINILYEG
jgi:hypothetical protein